nr:hypothetical protein [Tanacetum cinerariifolium]
SKSRNKNVDMTPRYKNDNQSGQFGNQRTMNSAGARENLGSLNAKRVKDSAYHKKKMLLCKQAEKGVPLQAEQYDWLADTDEDIDEQELEAHYSYMAKIQEVPTADTVTDSEPLEHVQSDTGYNVFANDLQHSEQSESISNTCLVETDDRNVIPDSLDMCDDDIRNDQSDVESDNERVALANLKLDVDENKKIQKQLKKANTTLAQELKECKTILAETSKTLGESISVRDSCLVALQNKQTEFEKYKAFNDRIVDYDKLECLIKQKTKVITDLKLREEHDIDKMLSIEKQLKFLNEIVYKRSQSIQTIQMMAPKVPTYNGRPTFANPRYLKQAQSEKLCLYAFPYDQSTHANRLIPDGEETLALERESRSKLNKDLNDSFIFVHELKQEMLADLKYVESLEKEIDELESGKAEFSNMYDMILQEFWNEQTSNVFRKEHEQYIKIQDLKAQLQDKNIAISESKKLIEKGKGKSVDTKFDKPSVVRQPNAQRIPKPSVLGVNHKTNVRRPQHRSNQLKDKVVPNNSQVKLKNTQVEEHPRISIDSDHFVYVTKMLNDVNARTNKPNGVPISTRKPKGHANKSVATPHKKKLASKSNNPKPQNYFRMLYEKTSNLKLLCNFVEKFLGTVRFGNDQFMPILGYGDLVQGKITINRVYYVKGLNHNLSSGLSHLNFDYINLLSKKDVVIDLLKLKYVKDQLCSSCELSKAKRSSLKSKAVPSSKGRLTLLHMDLCGPMRVASINGKKYILQMHMFHHNKSWIFYFGPLYDEFFNASSNPQDIQTSKIQPASAPFTLTYVHAEENNVNQAEEEHLPDDEFTNPFCVPSQEVVESSSHNIGNLNVPTFNQPQVFKYRWKKNHPLEQVYGNPSRPVQTRRQLATDPKMCMFALTVSTAKPKNIKEVMADSAWIKAMQEELHQFDRLQDKDQTVIRNKARLVANGYAQDEGIDFEESFAPVARL